MGYLGFGEEHSLAKMLPIRAVAHRPPDRGHGVCMDLTGIVYVFFEQQYTLEVQRFLCTSKDYCFSTGLKSTVPGDYSFNGL